MMNEITAMRSAALQAVGAKREKERNVQDAERRVLVNTREGWYLEQAAAIIQTVAMQTQKEVQVCLEGAVGHALQTVLGEPYQFHVDFEIKRQRTEACLSLSRNGNKLLPRDSSGGGVMDVISFTLMVLLWSISPRHPAPVMVLDEPFNWLDEERQPLAGGLLGEVCEQMGIQFIVVTHREELIPTGAKVFRVTRTNGASRVASE